VPRRRIELGVTGGHVAASKFGRRQVLAGFFGTLTIGVVGAEEQPRFLVAFANLNDDPSARVEGLGFSGADVRRSFELAARTLPVDMIYYDNAGDPEAALANAYDAIRHKVDLFIEYNSDTEANAEVARKLKAAAIPVLAVNYPVPGAPLYAADNTVAGQIAGKALGEFAKQTWADRSVVCVIAGDLGDPAAYLSQRVQGIIDGLHKNLPDITVVRLDTSGNPVRVDGLLTKFLASQTRIKVLVATLDDSTALAAKGAIERAGRMGDSVIVGQGLDRSVHGGANEKKEIDPNNRGSVILGSVAYFVDRYGYEVLPLAMKMLRGEQVPERTTTRHVLISAKNIFTEYPPYDMN
jgi:ABC-type sugar transport system substrate-binding protein